MLQCVMLGPVIAGQTHEIAPPTSSYDNNQELSNTQFWQDSYLQPGFEYPNPRTPFRGL